MQLRLPHIVDVRRPYDGEIRGYVVARNTHCIVIRELNGFLTDGFVVLPASSVTELVINETWTEMIAAEGHSSVASLKPPFVFDNIRTVVDYLITRSINVKLECENCSGKQEFGCHFGRVVEKHDLYIDFLFFNSLGRWFDGAYQIPYTSITQIVIHSKYVDTFSKYLAPILKPLQNSG